MEEKSMSLLIGIPREVYAGEKRVARVPEVVEKLIKLGFGGAVETGAGAAANFSDDAYRAAGAQIIADTAQLWAMADLVFKVRAPTTEEVALLRPGSNQIRFIWPARQPELMQQLAAKQVTVLAMDSIPRMSRAQKMDALSSMANIAGYRAVIEAAHHFGRFFPGQIPAAGSVIVDLASEQGGNCELTEPGQVVVKHGVTIIGYTDLPSRLAKQASTLYATNLLRLTEELCKTKDGVLNVNMDDEVIRGATVIKEGNITWPPPPPKLSAAPAKPAAAPASTTAAPKAHGHGGAGAPTSGARMAVLFGIAAALFWGIGAYAPAAFLGHFTVFVLACFVGYMVVWNVTPSLHTPLMSVTNAISSIIAIGALVQVAPPLASGVARPDGWIRALAMVGIVLTTINMFGGFAVTRRMLAMFRK